MEKSIFTKIIEHELPAEIIYEDEKVIVILNRFPNIEGEALVITKEQVPYVFNLDDDTYEHLMDVTKNMAKVLDRTFNSLRTCVVIEGFDVPHVHVRLYPVQEETLLLTHGPEASDEDLKRVGEKIRQNL
jgi:histidine triad (HIT) family protein